MVQKLNSLAVYCGHEFGTNPQFERDAVRVGELLARNKIRMIFGGGNVGLMGRTASSALRNGGVVLGVSTHNVVAKQEPAHEEITVEIVNGVNERKQRMYDLSDGFIILPGGIGTLNEFTDILTMQQIGETRKPIFFMNTAKFWNSFSQMFLNMQDNGFIESVNDYHVHVADTPDELFNQILNYDK
ncbi:MAG: TIGR00730 family Rossman fold protein [Alphaproteobacteria bacterium]|nr:TIGR00730 family Rossman fold protein [Alphaproteobacteria bacterium]